MKSIRTFSCTLFLLLIPWIYLSIKWIQNPLIYSVVVLGFIILSLFALLLLVWHQRRINVANTPLVLFRGVTILGICIVVFLCITVCLKIRGDQESEKFKSLTKEIVVGMDKASVDRILGKYFLKEFGGRFNFRSMPDQPKTHFCVTDAYVEYDEKGLVAQIEIFTPEN